jgi:F-box-like
MDSLPTEVLAQILIKVDPSTIYNLLLTSRFFVDILDNEPYWKIRVRRDTPLHLFGLKTYKWLYRCHLNRKQFKSDLSNTPWEDEQSTKIFVGDEREGQIIYKQPNERVMEEITANLHSLQAVEEYDRRFVSAGKTGYYTHLKIDNTIYFFRYAPYDALYVGILFNDGNIFIDFSPLYVGEIKHNDNEVFRVGEGVVVFRSGHTFTKNNWIDDAIFAYTNNLPVLTMNAMTILDPGLDAWIEYCTEKNINEQWVLDFIENV